MNLQGPRGKHYVLKTNSCMLFMALSNSRSAFKFYWITQPNYPHIEKNPIRARWRKLTNKWKQIYTDLFKEKQAEYMIEFEKYLRVS
jgi:hypothetical protein